MSSSGSLPLQLGEDLVAGLLEDLRPRIVVLVNPVAEAVQAEGIGLVLGVADAIFGREPAAGGCRSSISMTSTLAPPCSGPHRAQTPAAQEANRLARAEPTTRTVEVLQFCSWSAWRMKIRFRASSTSRVTMYCW